MAHQLIKDYPCAKQTLKKASEICERDLNHLRQRGPDDQLANPAVAEPLLAAIQIGYTDLLLESKLSPAVVAGYSAGEVAAYYAAGILSQDDALTASAIRGRVLEEYMSEQHRMISVTKLPTEKLINKVQDDHPAIEVAGWNSHDHVTLVGRRSAIQRCSVELRSMGAAISDVNVAGPWHSRLLRRASKEILKRFDALQFKQPSCEIYLSATGKPENEPVAIQNALAFQVSLPVRWQWTIEDLWIRGRRDYLEVGSGRVLVGMLRRNWHELTSFRAECVETAKGGLSPLKRILSSVPHQV